MEVSQGAARVLHFRDALLEVGFGQGEIVSSTARMVSI